MLREILQTIAILVVLLGGTANFAVAERKVALVIGNADYQYSTPLKNPANDARAVSRLFEQLGYDVHLHLDTDRASIAKVLGDFHQTSTNADSAIFYYAGHGVSVDGRNYLIPVDSDIQRATDVRLGLAIDAELAIEQALADAKVKIVFLDACRDNPFVEQIKRSLGATRSTSVSSGLSEMKSGAGTLIAFSTAPGQVALDGDGDNSPFAEALIKHLSEPGLEIRLAMTKVRGDVEGSTSGKQTPWESTNLTGFFYLSDQPVNGDTLSKATTTVDGVSESEIEFWRSVKDSHDEILLRSYMEQFPTGLYRPIAERLIKQLKSEAASKTDSASVSAKEESNFDGRKIPSKKSQEQTGTIDQSKIGSVNKKQTISKVDKSADRTPKNSPTVKKTPPKVNKTGKLNGNNDIQQPSVPVYVRRVISGWPLIIPKGATAKLTSPYSWIVSYQGRQYRCDTNHSQFCKVPK